MIVVIVNFDLYGVCEMMVYFDMLVLGLDWNDGFVVYDLVIG